MFSVKVVDSKGMGTKSKVLPGLIFYVCCDKGMVLQNEYDSFTDFMILPEGSRGATERRIAAKANARSCDPSTGVAMFLENFPEDRVTEIINFCFKKGIKELHLGDRTFPYHSHSFEIAEFISPTGGEFSLENITGDDYMTFANQRGFEREFLFLPYSLRKHYICEFKKHIEKGNNLCIDIPKGYE